MKFLDTPFYQYIKPEIEQLRREGMDLPAHFRKASAFLREIPADLGAHAYAPGKWTVAQVMGHLVDAQLVFLNRIVFIARGEAAPLPGFDENLWVESSGHREISPGELAEMHARMSQATETLVGSLPRATLSRAGLANGVEITAEEVLLYLVAHEKHHLHILKTRYLS
jgi:uncharacterized damage-inducible protein DinB